MSHKTYQHNYQNSYRNMTDERGRVIGVVGGERGESGAYEAKSGAYGAKSGAYEAKYGGGKEHYSKQQTKTPLKKNSPKKVSPKKRHSSPKKRHSSPKKTVQIKKPSLKEEDQERITNFKTIDNYVKSNESRQDQISKDKEELKSKFQGFILIPKEDYRCIQPNTYIRYLKDGNLYRSGGVLKLNKAPKYWVLQSTDKKSKIRWSVPLENTKNVYFQKDMEDIRRTARNKEKLYKAVMNNEFVVIPKDAFEKLRLLEEKENQEKEKQEAYNIQKKTKGGGEPDESSYYTSYTDYSDDEESSVIVDVKFQKRVL